MPNKVLGLIVTLWIVSISAEASEERQATPIRFWAPGLEEPLLASPRDGGLHLELEGSFWAYVIKGVSGTIALGNENEEGDFWTIDDETEGGWGGEPSRGSVTLEVNGHVLSELGAFFTVSGNEPGVSSEHKTIYFPQEYILRADADGNLDISLRLLVNSEHLEQGEGSANSSPSIDLVLLADIYRKPPETSGSLSSGNMLSSRTGTVTLHWSYTQGEEPSSSNALELADL